MPPAPTAFPFRLYRAAALRVKRPRHGLPRPGFTDTRRHALTNERDLSAPGARDDSVPHIARGKYTEEGGRLTLGISVEVNHRLIDGLHIGRFFAELTRLIDELPS